MKKISLRGLKEVLSDRELKNVLGGSGTGCTSCSSQSQGISCTCPNFPGRTGYCWSYPFAGMICRFD